MSSFSSAGVLQQLSLFEDDVVIRPEKVPRRIGWQVVDHCCAKCMGRLLVRHVGNKVEYRCCECGSTAVGSHEALCWCGIGVGTHQSAFVCIVNTSKTPALLNEVLVTEKPITQSPPLQDRQLKSAFSPEFDFF